jgi:hypothetical protein
MRRSIPLLVVLFLTLILTPPVIAETVLARGVAANGGGEAGGTNHTTVGTLGQMCIGIVAGPATIHEVGFWYPSPLGASAVDWQASTLPTRFSLGPARPNPSGQVMLIRYALPERARVAIVLYDVSGREVRTLINAELNPGYHDLRLTTDGLSSGIYFCRMTAEYFTETKRLVLLR